jgi:hypothetical protein
MRQSNRITTGHALIRQILFGTACAMLLLCTTENPMVDTGAGDLAIRLSLDRPGIKKALFNGSPIIAIAEFDDTVVCTFDNKQPEHIQLFTGSGRFRIPNEAILGKLVTRVEIPLYWLSKPMLTDTGGVRFDTLYIEVGQARSNAVRVNVVNIAPSIDSVIVGKTSVAVFADVFGDNVYRFDVDSQVIVALRVVARDADGDGLVTEWRALRNDTLLFQTSDDKRANYKAPIFNFLDTVSVVVADGKLGNVQVNLLLQRTKGLKVLQIDSVTCIDSTSADTAQFVVFADSKIDTARIKVFITNRSGDSPTVSWTASVGSVTATSAGATTVQAQYVSADPRSVQALKKDTVLIIDTVAVSIALGNADTVRKRIVITQVPANRRPVIDSFAVDKIVIPTNTHRVKAADTVTIRVYTHDPDGVLDKRTVVWTSIGSRGKVVNSNGDTANYAVPASGNDTVIITAADTLKFKAIDTLILLVNRPPRIDSVAVGNVHFKATVATRDVFTYADTANDTIACNLFGRELDAGDSMLVAWTVKGGRQAGKSFNRTSFQYLASNIAYKDTATCIINDRYGLNDTAVIYMNIVK